MSEEQDEAVLRITAQYVSEVEAGKQPNLSDYLLRYPQHAYAIANFVAYYHDIDRVVDVTIEKDYARQGKSTVSSTSSPLSDISRPALERAKNRVLAPSMTTLLVTKDGQRVSPSQLARTIDLSADIILLLEQRKIDVNTIPSELFRRLATALQQPIHVVQAYLTSAHEKVSSPTFDVHSYARVAENQEEYTIPSEHEQHTIQQESFSQVLQASQKMSYSQKAMWKAILAQEKLQE